MENKKTVGYYVTLFAIIANGMFHIGMFKAGDILSNLLNSKMLRIRSAWHLWKGTYNAYVVAKEIGDADTQKLKDSAIIAKDIFYRYYLD